jgi:hypothetical protein
MSIQLKIAEPQHGASEVATATRESLQQWIESVQDKCGDRLAQVLDSAEAAKHVQCGRGWFEDALVDTYNGTRPPAYRMILAFMRALSRTGSRMEGDARVASYRVEGVMRAFAKAVFDNKLSFSPMERRVYMDLTSGGADMSGIAYANTVNYTGGGDIYLQPFLESLGRAKGAIDGFVEQRKAQLRISNEVSGTPFVYYGSGYILDEARGRMIIPVGYMDVDGPWVAGFLTPDDTARLRFTRKRLGAWLKDSGLYNDEEIRATVEQAKTQQTGGVFTIYPNDVLFGEIYYAGVNAGGNTVGSCMASPPDDYCTWDGIHPCDVYSTAYYGVGDNGLALFTAENEVGDMVGRGIWNRSTKKIVRWYGDATKFRALSRIGMERDTEALEGAWLAHIANGSKFIAPYVDGDIGCGKVAADEGRVYLRSDGSISLSETSGVVGVETVYCEDDGEYHDREECTYQSEHNNYIWNDTLLDEWMCCVTGEWVEESYRRYVYISGEESEVSVRVINRLSQYLREVEPTEDMLEEFDEDDVPTNYEIR